MTVIHEVKVFFFKILERKFKNSVFTIRSGLAKGFKRRYGFGFRPKFLLTKEEEFLMSIDFNNKTVYDIGGYVGIHAMFYSQAVGCKGKVITFEPNPKNYNELLCNLHLNKISNVLARNIGLGQRTEETMLIFDPTLPGRGTVRKDLKKERLKKSGSEAITIEIDSLDNILQKEELPYPDFVKIDVEGFEMDVLKGMHRTLNKYGPDLFIEIHGVLPKEMIDFLYSAGYSIYHIELDMKIINSNDQIIRGGHIYCRRLSFT